MSSVLQRSSQVFQLGMRILEDSICLEKWVSIIEQKGEYECEIESFSKTHDFLSYLSVRVLENYFRFNSDADYTA